MLNIDSSQNPGSQLSSAMSNQSVKKIEKILLAFSVFVFCIFFQQEASYAALIFSAILGVLFALLICKTPIRHRETSLISKLLSLLVSIAILIVASLSFVQTWNVSSLIARIASAFNFSVNTFLLIIGALFSLFSLPVLSFFLNRLFCFTVISLKQIHFDRLKKELVDGYTPKIFFKNIAQIIAALLIMLTIGVALLVFAFTIPTQKIAQNVEISASTFKEEGTYPSVFSWCQSRLDNFTDAIMLLEAANDNDNSAINQAMMAYRGSIDGEGSPDKVLISHYIDGIEFDHETSYARYWHGYHIFLKPLLSIAPYSSIRIINGIAQVVLVLFVSLLLYKRNIKELILPYWLSYFMLMPIALAKSFQYSSCFYIITFGMIFLLLAHSTAKSSWICFIFLFLGILTAYFDFLTYPIATLGVPCVLYLYLNSCETLEKKIVSIVKISVYWCLGYVGMWASKWILGNILTDTNVVSNALTAVSFMASNSYNDTYYPIFSVISNNVSTFLRTPVTIPYALLCFVLTYRVLWCRQISAQHIVQIIIPYFIVGLFPFLWYLLATNHSAIHYSFTNKACIVTLLAILFGIIELFEKNRAEKRK